MAPQTSAMLLLLVGSVLWCHGRCQHWSYGLSPGGKRDLDGRSDTVSSPQTLFIFSVGSS
ncbi:Progonadoliberin-1 [Nibea albiflora]|uniref:Progonadoliberin-1 n=1 Tax=Nibea albiflora TaxID=240163 RepID=A0ACB7FDM7_NIBAL|nr:Progonadoliberin-1 [Nibea albiflora]